MNDKDKMIFIAYRKCDVSHEKTQQNSDDVSYENLKIECIAARLYNNSGDDDELYYNSKLVE